MKVFPGPREIPVPPVLQEVQEHPVLWAWRDRPVRKGFKAPLVQAVGRRDQPALPVCRELLASKVCKVQQELQVQPAYKV